MTLEEVKAEAEAYRTEYNKKWLVPFNEGLWPLPDPHDDPKFEEINQKIFDIIKGGIDKGVKPSPLSTL